MSVTRRHFLEMGAVGLPLGMLAACGESTQPPSPGAPGAPPGQPPAGHIQAQGASAQAFQGQKGAVVVFEGLSVLVLSGRKDGNGAATPHAAAVALLNLAPAIAAGPNYPSLPIHYPTLVVPRGQVASTSTAKPVAADLFHAYYPLAGMNVTFEPKSGSALGSSAIGGLSFGVSNGVASGCPVEATWNNIGWLLDIPRDLHLDAKLILGWKDSPYVHTLLQLASGDLEDRRLDPSDPGGQPSGRTWKARGVDRFFKEVVRHRLPYDSHIHVSLQPRSGVTAPGGVVVVDCTKVRAQIDVLQLPVPFMGNPNALTDLVGYYGLLEGGLPLIASGQAQVPTFVKEGCGTGATSECSCCPMGLIYDPSWI